MNSAIRNAPKIGRDEMVFVAGRNGSGKTELARQYLAGWDSVYVLDSKNTFEWLDTVDKKEVTRITKLAEINDAKTPKVVYSPVLKELNQDYYNAFFQYCYFKRNCTVLIDELMGICESSRQESMPEYLKGILTRGRELKVSAWCLTQRPKNIPVLAMSEAKHFFIFDLNMKEDRDRVAQLSGFKEMEEKPGQYVFWYANINSENAIRAKLDLPTKKEVKQ